jgi:pimeloyl-ACP methyl ester carboxylesterase
MNPICKTIISGGSALNYHILGEGPIAFFIHGFAEDHTIWESQVNALSTHYCCIVPDLFGSGNSNSLNESTITSIDDLARCINEIMEAEKVNQAVVFGHSMGGYIAMAFAAIFPKRLLGLGLIHSTSYADTEEKKTMRRKIMKYWEIHGSKETQKNSVPGLFAEQNRNIPQIKKQIVIAENIRTEDMMGYYGLMIDRPDRSQVLKEIKVPVLMVAGKLDPAIPYEQSIAQSILPDNCEIKLLQESGHMGMIEEKVKINQILTDFMTRIVERSKL